MLFSVANIETLLPRDLTSLGSPVSSTMYANIRPDYFRLCPWVVRKAAKCIFFTVLTCKCSLNWSLSIKLLFGHLSPLPKLSLYFNKDFYRFWKCRKKVSLSFTNEWHGKGSGAMVNDFSLNI